MGSTSLKPLIRLYDMVGTSLIVPAKTGVIYSNQTGGTACLQPQQEGFVIPFCNDISLPGLKLVSPENKT